MKKRKKEIEKGLDSIIKTIKKDSKSWAEINTDNYLKKNKITKEHSRVHPGLCLMKTDKN